mmetsp:Transcript_21897/g.47652  ORF Transcript_21897/g.47652 Transcript_21897/m.47652 type:complete len:743 (-) Transcript_21897:128-2356(-)
MIPLLLAKNPGTRKSGAATTTRTTTTTMGTESKTKTEPSIGSGAAAAAAVGIVASSSSSNSSSNSGSYGHVHARVRGSNGLFVSARGGSTRLVAAAQARAATSRLTTGTASGSSGGGRPTTSNSGSSADTTTTTTTTTRLYSNSGNAGSETSSNAGDGHNDYNRSSFRKKIQRIFGGVLAGRQEQQQQQQQQTAAAARATPVVSPIEPFLHMIPEGLHTCYRPLPRAVQALTVLLATRSAVASVSNTYSRKALVIATSSLSSSSSVWSILFWVRKITALLIRSVAFVLVAQVVLQETLFRNKVYPSRVTPTTLVERYCLPTSLSRYEPITIASDAAAANCSCSNDHDPPFSLGVHYLQYNNDDDDGNRNGNGNGNGKNSAEDTNIDGGGSKQNNYKFDSVYFQHGFGASSLSWLPVLPKLAQKLNARVALGHDAVGFGFTDRPRGAKWYTAKQSSRIAHQILWNKKGEGGAVGRAAGVAVNNRNRNDTGHTSSSTSNDNTPLCLVGHSKGPLSILRLATRLPRETPKLIILSSPALGLLGRKEQEPLQMQQQTSSSSSSLLPNKLRTAIGRTVLGPAARYVLRRLVGTPNAWRKGLAFAWGDPGTNPVTEDSDVLRYAWPSIGRGWEEGLLRFAGAQGLPREDELDDDVVLFRRVLQLPKTKVLILLGSRDRVVPTATVRGFLETVRNDGSASSTAAAAAAPIVVELENLGHNAFEEDREIFCETVEQLMVDHWDSSNDTIS